MSMRSLALGLLVVVAAVPVSATWWAVRHQGDLPAHLSAVQWSPSGSRALVVGDTGAVFLSTDSGSTWQRRSSGVTADLLAVAWQSEATAWACGERSLGWTRVGDLLRSTDGGLSWTVELADHPASLTSVVFVDPVHGWVGEAATELLRTTDGGATWDALAGGSPTSTLEFLDSHIGFAAGSGMDFDLFRSTDGGSTWALAYENPNGTIIGVDFASPSQGFLADPVSVSVSTDGGLTWGLRASLSEAWLADLELASPSLGWLVGHRQAVDSSDALILVSTDGGFGWSQQTFSSPNGLSAVSAWDSSRVLTAGRYGTLARTSDGGQTWTSCPARAANDILDLAMADASSGWAVGPPNLLERTSDGGRSWMRVAGVGASTLEGLFRLDATNLFACGLYSFVASTDGGTTWEERNGSLDCHDLHFSDSLTGLAGTRYGIWRTTDGGYNWDYVAGMGLGGVFGFDFVDQLLGFAAAGIENILGTTDGGVTWTTAYSAPPPSVYLSAVDFADASHGWATGAGGLVVATTDGGVSWAEQASGVTDDLWDVHFWTASSGLVVGSNGRILETSDGGATWIPAASPTSTDLFCIAAVGPSNVWIGGAWAVVLVPDSPPLFADGFESGDASRWSTAVP